MSTLALLGKLPSVALKWLPATGRSQVATNWKSNGPVPPAGRLSTLPMRIVPGFAVSVLVTTAAIAPAGVIVAVVAGAGSGP